MTDTTTLAIEYLQSEQGQKALEKWPVRIGDCTLHASSYACRMHYDNVPGGYYINIEQALALAEHDARRRLEERCERVAVDCCCHLASDRYRVTAWRTGETPLRMVRFAPTLIEALHKALEGTGA